MIIFDCDGVLVETEYLFAQADAALLTKRGFQITAEQLMHRYAGILFEDMMEDLCRHLGDVDDPKQLALDMRDHAIEHVRKSVMAVEGIEAVVRAVQGPKCIASNSRHDHIQSVLATVGLYDDFAPHIFSAYDVPRPKPHPDLHLHAASIMGADPKACVVIEDSVTGVQAARAAGIDVVGLTAARHVHPDAPKQLTDAGAKFVATTTAELLSWLKGYQA